MENTTNPALPALYLCVMDCDEKENSYGVKYFSV